MSLDEGGSAFRLEDCKDDDTSFSFQLKLTKAAYEGTKSNDGKTISGKWKQAGTEFDLVMQHFEKASEDGATEVWTGQIGTLFQKLTLRIRVYKQQDRRLPNRRFHISAKRCRSGVCRTRSLSRER